MSEHFRKRPMSNIRLIGSGFIALCTSLFSTDLAKADALPQMTTAGSQQVITSVALPIYTATKPDSDVHFVTIDLTGSQYLKAGSDQFEVHSNVRSTMVWYETHMPKYGYVQNSADYTNKMLTFSLKKDSNLTVEIIFRQISYAAKDIYVEYFVTDMKTPSRLAASLVPSDSTQVLISYQPASEDEGQPLLTRTLTTKTQINVLAYEINALPVDIRTDVGAESSLRGGAVLQFTSATGYTTEVHVDFQKNQVQVNKFPLLFDFSNTVWNTISKDMGHQPYLSS